LNTALSDLLSRTPIFEVQGCYFAMRFLGSIINDITVQVHGRSDVGMPHQFLLKRYCSPY
jgi:hypothetical protein